MNSIFEEDEKKIRKIVNDFYSAFYESNCEEMFSYLNKSFQESVPLDYYLIHSRFDIDIGILIDIRLVTIEKENKRAFVECDIDFERGKKETVIVLVYEDEMWKIDSRSIYKRR